MLENLVCINIRDCRNCTELPPFRKLSSLRDLIVGGMNLIRFLDSGSYHHGEVTRGFMRLKNLVIGVLPNLERLSKEEGREVFPCLSKLRISACPKLTLPCIPSLEKLEVSHCSDVLLKTVSNLNGLTSLEITYDDQIISFPYFKSETYFPTLKLLRIFHLTKLQEFPVNLLSGLSALETLHIQYCDELECLPEGLFRGSSCLKNIAITHCMKLKSLPESFKHLTALQYLHLEDCPELAEEAFPDGLDNFSSLKSMIISGKHMTSMNGRHYFPVPRPSNKLVHLPEAFRHLPSIERICISFYENLTLLPDWLGNLSSLQRLEISNCPNLPYLPTSIQQLTNLQYLGIDNCPKLKERCQKETGEDWHKIAHIPEVFVG